MSERLVRAAAARVLDLRDGVIAVGRDGVAREFHGDTADLLRAVLDRLQTPATRDELLAHLATLTDGAAPAAPVDALLSLLRASGVVTVARDPPRAPPGRRVVLGVAGAVAAVDAASLVRALQARGHEVRVALTRDARRFVRAEPLAALTHHAVYRGLWHRTRACPVPHVDLAAWADAVVIAPATATTIARVAHGDCSDLVAAVAIATRAPVLVAPSMNPAMYAAPAVQRALARLREDGVAVVHPGMGAEVAQPPGERAPVYGPMAPPGAIVDLLALLLRRSNSAPRVDWEALHAATAPEALPWHADALDDDLAAALARIAAEAPGARLVDLGTSLGTAAVAAARMGFVVVATDVSPSAIERAAGRAGDAPVTWLVDDVRASALRGRFDVALDRGCLHVLPRADHGAYMATVRRLVRPGGWWVVKAHHRDEPGDHGTCRLGAPDLAALAGDGFSLERADDAWFPRPGAAARRAVLAVFRRR